MANKMVDKQSNNSTITIIISDNLRDLISLVTMVFMCGFISVLGAFGNVINMIVFYRQGLNTTINISFFSLALSDLCSLIVQQLYNLYINPLFIQLNLPIVYNQFQYITTALNREVFARITCQITVFVTAERCLCVVFPLHVKRIITPRIASLLIAAIYVLTILSPYPIFCTTYPTWRFYPALNRSLLGFSVTSHHLVGEAFVYLSHAIFTLLGFTSVLVFTLILIYQLGQKSVWRQSANADQDKAKSMSKRDRTTIRMVVLIACILIVTYTPAVFLGLATFLEPQFSPRGKYYNLYYSCWKLAILLEVINSSVNVFFYYRMSTKYRHTFRDLFSVCLQPGKKADGNSNSTKLPAI